MGSHNRILEVMVLNSMIDDDLVTYHTPFSIKNHLDRDNRIHGRLLKACPGFANPAHLRQPTFEIRKKNVRIQQLWIVYKESC